MGKKKKIIYWFFDHHSCGFCQKFILRIYHDLIGLFSLSINFETCIILKLPKKIKKSLFQYTMNFYRSFGFFFVGDFYVCGMLYRKKEKDLLNFEWYEGIKFKLVLVREWIRRFYFSVIWFCYLSSFKSKSHIFCNEMLN